MGITFLSNKDQSGQAGSLPSVGNQGNRVEALPPPPPTEEITKGAKQVLAGWDPILGFGAAPILEPILVGVGMFTGGTIWVWTHGHIQSSCCFRDSSSVVMTKLGLNIAHSILISPRQAECLR